VKMLLELSFKGSRDYLQGGDIFNALKNVVPIVSNHKEAFICRLSFRNFAKMACELTTDPPNELTTIIGEVRFAFPNELGHLDAWVVLTDIPVRQRKPFDEDLLLASAKFDQVNRSASLISRSEWTAIEEIIALTKYLNYAVNPNVKGKWVFGQLDLKQDLLDNYLKLDVKMINLIPGRFSVNNIFIDGDYVGSIRFIVSK
jgi:hypothetical protein